MNAFQTTVLAIGTTIACLIGASIVLWWAYEAIRLLHREWRGREDS